MRKIAAWALYWIGYQIGRLCFVNSVLCDIFYRPSQQLLLWSDDVQGDTDQGPWYESNEE